MQPGDIYEKLAEGERKEVARSIEVAHSAVVAPEMLPHLIDLLAVDNPTIVSHAAHALMTVSRIDLALLVPHKSALVRALASNQWEVQEQLGKIIPSMPLDSAEQAMVWARFHEIFYQAKSSIARTCALQALVDMGNHFEAYRGNVSDVIVYAMEEGTKAMQARARNILREYDWVASTM